jgi:hypothetical protein
MLQSGRFDSLIEKLVSKTINLLDNKWIILMIVPLKQFSNCCISA